MPPISVLIKPSSGLCNMKCDYCFYCDETKKRARESYGFMTEQTLKNHFLVGLSVDGTKRFMIVIDIPKMEHQHLTESDL